MNISVVASVKQAYAFLKDNRSIAAGQFLITGTASLLLGLLGGVGLRFVSLTQLAMVPAAGKTILFSREGAMAIGGIALYQGCLMLISSMFYLIGAAYLLNALRGKSITVRQAVVVGTTTFKQTFGIWLSYLLIGLGLVGAALLFIGVGSRFLLFGVENSFMFLVAVFCYGAYSFGLFLVVMWYICAFFFSHQLAVDGLTDFDAIAYTSVLYATRLKGVLVTLLLLFAAMNGVIAFVFQLFPFWLGVPTVCAQLLALVTTVFGSVVFNMLYLYVRHEAQNVGGHDDPEKDEDK